MRQIELTQGQVAIVDEFDYEWLNQWKWHAVKMRGGMKAARHIPKSGGRKIYMHRQIMAAPVGMDVDHRDHNTLNNRKENLRVCTTAQNIQNQLPSRGETSGFKGVTWDKRDRKWKAYIRIKGRQKFLGYYDDEIEAALVYDTAARRVFKEFACCNFPQQGREGSERI